MAADTFVHSVAGRGIVLHSVSGLRIKERARLAKAFTWSSYEHRRNIFYFLAPTRSEYLLTAVSLR